MTPEEKQAHEVLVNDLQNTIKELDGKLDEIYKTTLHAGCMGNPNCHNCQIQKIIGERKLY